MSSFCVPVDNTGTAAVHLVAGAAGQQVTLRGFLLTPAADVEVRFRDTAGSPLVLATFLFGKGASLDISVDGIGPTAEGLGLDIITLTSVRITGVVWGTIQ